MGELLHLIKKLAMLVMLFPLKLFPIKKNRLMLNNGLSHNYSDSPKAVAEFLCRCYPHELEIFFAVDEPEKYRFLEGKGIRPVKFLSLRYFYCVMTAAVYLTNNGGYSYLPLRKKQLVIETWHGGGVYKKCGIWEYKNKTIGRAALKLAARNVDVFLSTSKRSSDILSASFLLPWDIFWEIGMPRNDILLRQNTAAKKKIRDKLGLSNGEWLVLFAPTFRRLDNACTGTPVAIPYGIDDMCVCRALQERFTGTWRFALRLHPEVRRGGKASCVLDISDYEDMQELLYAADVLITDFSSSMWDFLLTGRPCFLFAVDFDRYVRTTEVYAPVSEWPFPKASSNEELERNILGFDEERYAEACARHYAELGGCETGRAAELVGERIREHMAGLKTTKTAHRK